MGEDPVGIGAVGVQSDAVDEGPQRGMRTVHLRHEAGVGHEAADDDLSARLDGVDRAAR